MPYKITWPTGQSREDIEYVYYDKNGTCWIQEELSRGGVLIPVSTNVTVEFIHHSQNECRETIARREAQDIENRIGK